jgi:hypothetical protein
MAKIETRTGKKLDDLFPEFLIPNFDIIFKVDDMIDNGKTMEEQRHMLHAIVTSVESGAIDSLFPEEIAKTVRECILSSESRTKALLSELAAEIALLNPDLDWVEAMIQRARVTLYSALLVLDFAKLLQAYDEYRLDIPYSRRELAHVAAMWAIATATADDYLDREDDIKQNKVTGMTQCDDPKAVFTTIVTFFRTQVKTSADLWPIEAFTGIYFDPRECIRIFYQEAPRMAQYLFRTENENIAIEKTGLNEVSPLQKEESS